MQAIEFLTALTRNVLPSEKALPSELDGDAPIPEGARNFLAAFVEYGSYRAEGDFDVTDVPDWDVAAVATSLTESHQEAEFQEWDGSHHVPTYSEEAETRPVFPLKKTIAHFDVEGRPSPEYPLAVIPDAPIVETPNPPSADRLTSTKNEWIVGTNPPAAVDSVTQPQKPEADSRQFLLTPDDNLLLQTKFDPPGKSKTLEQAPKIPNSTPVPAVPGAIPVAPKQDNQGVDVPVARQTTRFASLQPADDNGNRIKQAILTSPSQVLSARQSERVDTAPSRTEPGRRAMATETLPEVQIRASRSGVIDRRTNLPAALDEPVPALPETPDRGAPKVKGEGTVEIAEAPKIEIRARREHLNARVPSVSPVADRADEISKPATHDDSFLPSQTRAESSKPVPLPNNGSAQPQPVTGSPAPLPDQAGRQMSVPMLADNPAPETRKIKTQFPTPTVELRKSTTPKPNSADTKTERVQDWQKLEWRPVSTKIEVAPINSSPKSIPVAEIPIIRQPVEYPDRPSLTNATRMPVSTSENEISVTSKGVQTRPRHKPNQLETAIQPKVLPAVKVAENSVKVTAYVPLMYSDPKSLDQPELNSPPAPDTAKPDAIKTGQVTVQAVGHQMRPEVTVSKKVRSEASPKKSMAKESNAPITMPQPMAAFVPTSPTGQFAVIAKDTTKDLTLPFGEARTTDLMLGQTADNQRPDQARNLPDVRMARHIATQLHEAVRQMPDRPVEITLRPEELGRVKLSVATGDGTIQVTLTAERQETMDLLRRNIDQLADEFRGLGFEDIAFNFGEQDGGEERELADEKSKTINSPGRNLDEPEHMTPLSISLGAGVDIRI